MRQLAHDVLHQARKAHGIALFARQIRKRLQLGLARINDHPRCFAANAGKTAQILGQQDRTDIQDVKARCAARDQAFIQQPGEHACLIGGIGKMQQVKKGLRVQQLHHVLR